jgi:hypothetical protein
MVVNKWQMVYFVTQDADFTKVFVPFDQKRC